MHNQPDNHSGITILGRPGRGKGGLQHQTRRTGPEPRGTNRRDTPVVFLDLMAIRDGAQR